MTVTIRAFDPADTEHVVALWTEAGLTRPWNDPRRDIERKLAVQPELFLVAEVPAQAGPSRFGEASYIDDAPNRPAAETPSTIVGSVMAGYDGHRGWLYYLATAAVHRHRGIARALVDEAERLLVSMGCPKVQLMVRDGNEAVLEFYDRMGYERFSVSNTGKRLIADA